MEKVRLGPRTFLYPMPVVLVGATVNGNPNFMAASWCAIAALKPPAVSVAINKARHTLKGVREHGNFSVNVASSSLVKKVDYCGIYSGENTDKSQIFTIFYGELKTAPLIEECSVNLECKTLHYVDLGSHMLVIGEIIETFMAEGCLVDGKGDPEKIDPLIFITGTRKYHRLGEEIAPAFRIGKE
jgi:flavin reductase (DIM6/NTAB) family NADH-FMN oxidoreductase RutF